MATIAGRPDLFSFLSESDAAVDVEVGDGRLLLEQQTGPKDDAVVIDAFSGDSIPAHLMTDEAMALYLERITDDGAIVFHISNRFFDFSPIVARLAAEHGLVAYEGSDEPSPEAGSSGQARQHLGRHGPHRRRTHWLPTSRVGPASPPTRTPRCGPTTDRAC